MTETAIHHQSSAHEQQLESLLAEVAIESATRYSVKGEPLLVYQQSVHQHYVNALCDFGANQYADKNARRQQLVQHVSNTLYSQFYCGISQETAELKWPAKKQRDTFMNTLSQRNTSVQEPDRNWKVYAVDAQGNAFAEKNGALRQVLPNTYMPQAQYAQGGLVVNQTVDFYRQKEKRDAQTTFYYVYGNEYLASDCSMMRLYWNISPQGVGDLIEQVTTLLNDYRISFHFKCLNHPELYHRNDSAVLYFDKAQLAIVSLLIKQIIASLKAALIDKTPLFTDEIAPGVALAEDPGQGQSFGMSRTMLIAEALVSAHEEGVVDKTERDAYIKQYLTNKGVNLQRMSLNPHTAKLILH